MLCDIYRKTDFSVLRNFEWRLFKVVIFYIRRGGRVNILSCGNVALNSGRKLPDYKKINL